MRKKISGYDFYVIFAILILTLIALSPSLIKAFVGFYYVISGKLEAYAAGEVIGQLIYWAIHIVAIILFWKYARKWTKKTIG